MPQHSKENILVGRTAVDSYRAGHAELHKKLWHRGIPEEHTPLLNVLLAGLKEQGFNSLGKFFDTSEELNVQELGFGSREDFRVRATAADREAFDRMWR